MRLALISDTHFGDPLCTLVRSSATGKPIAGPRYKDFLRATGKGNDYLILVGDILDFAIQSYSKAYEAARAFFTMVQNDGVARQMVYVPGNHDGDIWHIVEHQVNIIHQIERKRLPREFRMSLPGVIDARSSRSRKRLILPGVSERRVRGRLGYGGLFLDALTSATGKATRFNFTYPNLYFASDQGGVLITHGHYLEPYWALASEWAPELFEAELRVHDPMLLREMVAINFPLNQLACSGTGQAGPLTPVIYGIQADVAARNLEALEPTLERAERALLGRFFRTKGMDLRRWVASSIARSLRKRLLRSLGNMESSRYNAKFMESAAVRARFETFFARSCGEIDELNQAYGLELPHPAAVVFGHTHQPVPWGAEEAALLKTPSGARVRLFNSGGWVERVRPDGAQEFCGAEVFRFETSEGWSSISVP